ncbi:DUF368 domain-containing protein [Ruminococcaceae bacterium OttesenSCG-928-A16]|nr:DUF368 domain-containing protein [Ruminococcaceae bacterium OttesenSCG-928-A16]
MEKQNKEVNQQEPQKENMVDWFVRFIKGMFIGTGFILPGVSGGALAAVFGLYERMISFLAHITREFKKNLLYFLPVGFGGIVGVVLVSFLLSFFLEGYEPQMRWLFVGCILGTLPALWKEAGKKGRKKGNIILMVASAVLGTLFLWYGDVLFGGGSMPLNFGTWMMAGALIGLGVLVPGLSPSNFLMYFNMYKPMVDAFKNFDVMVILAIGLGGLICLLAFSKLMDYLFDKVYAGLFHFILGIVFASTVMIIPWDYNYASLGTIGCVLLCIGGIALGYWMSSLEEKYKPEKA